MNESKAAPQCSDHFGRLVGVSNMMLFWQEEGVLSLLGWPVVRIYARVLIVRISVDLVFEDSLPSPG